MKRKISLIIQPTHMCNLKCIYCYDKENHPIREFKKIEIEKIEKIFLILKENYNIITCIWLGGEPILYGIDNYKKVLEIQTQISQKYGIIFNNSMETNGLLLDDTNLSFFKDNGFNVSISYDGSQNIMSRHVESKKIQDIILNVKKKYGYAGSLYVLNKINAPYLIDDYEFYKENEISLKISNCFGEKENDKLYLTSREYANIMFELFVKYENYAEHISPFNEYLKMIYNDKATSCNFGSCLGKFLCIDVYGNLYPCGRFGYIIDNIKNINSIKDIFFSENYVKLIKLKQEKIVKCKKCELFYYCGSGCLHRSLINNNHCEEFKLLFNKIKMYVTNKNS